MGPQAGVGALLVERDSNSPVMTESRLGLGRVFFMGADETWRWRFKSGEADFDRARTMVVETICGGLEPRPAGDRVPS